MKYTPKDIEERFEEAASTLRRLPDTRVPGYFSTWPPMIRAAAEAYGYDPARMPRIAPTPQAISRMATLGGCADRHLEQALRAAEARERQEQSEEHCRNEPQTTSRRRCLNVFNTAQDV